VNLKNLEKAVISKGAELVTYQGDISLRKTAEGLVETAVEVYGRIDVLVNNAGIMRNAPFLEMTEEDWDEVIKVNLKGAFNCAQEAARNMVQNKSGTIINISSRAYLGAQQMTNYSASKAALLGMTKCMAIELGPYGITVNAVAPGTIDTELTRQMFDKFVEQRISATPLRRIGRPEEIAYAVIFLASPEAKFITGEILHVTGGFY
jgi:3-oxoacyl-[acyl-carrier protein] reductase